MTILLKIIGSVTVAGVSGGFYYLKNRKALRKAREEFRTSKLLLQLEVICGNLNTPRYLYMYMRYKSSYNKLRTWIIKGVIIILGAEVLYVTSLFIIDSYYKYQFLRQSIHPKNFVFKTPPNTFMEFAQQNHKFFEYLLECAQANNQSVSSYLSEIYASEQEAYYLQGKELLYRSNLIKIKEPVGRPLTNFLLAKNVRQTLIEEIFLNFDFKYLNAEMFGDKYVTDLASEIPDKFDQSIKMVDFVYKFLTTSKDAKLEIAQALLKNQLPDDPSKVIHFLGASQHLLRKTLFVLYRFPR
jgi:hypothetical protein